MEWSEYRIGDLFDIQKVKSYNTDKIIKGNEYDYITRTSTNQGVLCTTDFINEEGLNDDHCWSLGLLQLDIFYRKRKWYAGQFVRKITPKININKNEAHFFTVALNSIKPRLKELLVRDVDKVFLNSYIKLPSADGEIDFDSIKYIVTLLERIQKSKVKKYLEERNLTECNLYDFEQKTINNYNKLEWKTFKVGELFQKVKVKKVPYKAKELPNTPKGDFDLPCLTSSFMNQGLNYFAPRDNLTILSNVITIPSNSDIYRAYYQPNEFTVLSDAYAIQWKSEYLELTENQYLFFVQCINKVTDLNIYSYKNKLGGWNTVKEKEISLPVKDGDIDYTYMERFITAMKKILMKNINIEFINEDKV
ncbi:TPA: type I restriction endonuclease subunit R [Staphylococcus pseudintermedius]|nr:type I restriction endonuclease subunit R [Staphylococcus pseudintermedius]EGQ2835865.1 type I restriction endonuclease subunit R [Staphylococcus pseudintermedius]EGQ3033267.1 type I restriction endonuclease subunit R [Staphylococcus pseudintermedius]EGQ3183643.1 type I restriction endonuclease subunit R [Staphylococcus pseudintermedius]EGQ3619426.1 type I restriction endonuclease subunit R [Staphylococcus pseudintermedius]